MTSTIPKIIHLCWLSGDPYPESIEKCIGSWKSMMPDYKIVLWDADRFSKINNRFAKEAFANRKWAFAADYIRLHALYNHGGIYLDSDVRVFKRFDNFLSYGFFSGIEYFKPTNYIAIEAAIMGSVRGHPFIKECLDLYSNIPFVRDDGLFDETTITVRMAQLAEDKWGFLRSPKRQILRGNMLLCSPVTFTNPSGEFSKSKTYALHLCNGSWREGKDGIVSRFFQFVLKYYRNPISVIENLYKKLYIKVVKHFF